MVIPAVPQTRDKAIFWDNDGVLVDTEHVYFEATRQVLASAGIDLTRDEYIELFLVQGRGAWHLGRNEPSRRSTSNVFAPSAMPSMANSSPKRLVSSMASRRSSTLCTADI